ncbi:MAG TPA: pyridoxamine 5'-phosphate oxidase family protein [Chloroflexota bacterium]|nr:pyridoxamine 5'-phosphate oxidase family protein [Chloroflexota bacterium]
MVDFHGGPGLPGLRRLLFDGQPCVLATVDSAGAPYTTFMSWVSARDDHTVCLALDTRGTALRNIQNNPSVALEILGPDRIIGIRGKASISDEPLRSCPFPAVLVEIDVLEGRDHTGKEITWHGPAYSYVTGKEHRYAIEHAVLEELRAGA